MRILIVAVNYNSYDQLNDYLISVRNSIRTCKYDVEVKIAVADNSTQKEIIQSQDNDVLSLEVYQLPNLGYFGGAQYIINSIENKIQYDYIAISNVDLNLNEDFFQKLLQYQCSRDTGWVAPSIYSLRENRDKKTLYRPSKRHFQFLCLLFKYPILLKLYSKTLYKRKRKSFTMIESKEVYSGHGAFFLLTREFFVRNPRLDFKPFLFCEENYIAELLRRSSLKCIYEPSLKIWDDEHVSTGKINYRKMCRYSYEAHRFIYDNFY